MTDEELRDVLSQNIKKYRKVHKWSQAQLALKTGVSGNFINDMESQKKGASLITIGKLARAFEIEPYELIKPLDQFPESINGIIQQYTENIQLALEQTRHNFIQESKKSHK